MLSLSSNVFAGTIQQIKNGKVLISLDGTSAQVGEQFFALNENNKKTAIIEIITVKSDKAVGKITKGTAKLNDKILSKGMGPVTPQDAKQESEKKLASKSASFIRHDLNKIAFNIKSSLDTISTLQQTAPNPFSTQETVDMKGNNIGLNVSLAYPMGENFYIQGFGGYEILKASGTANNLVCDGKSSRDCNVDISYITLGGLARYNYISNHFEFWAGAGVGFKQPLSKKSTALTLDNITLANAVIVALGMDYHLSNSAFIPLSFEYHKSFNESETVPLISHMALQVGYGLIFY
jgi:hypothetical protein